MPVYFEQMYFALKTEEINYAAVFFTYGIYCILQSKHFTSRVFVNITVQMS